MCFRLEIDVTSRLGEGEFGLVRPATLRASRGSTVAQAVAVKMLKGDVNRFMSFVCPRKGNCQIKMSPIRLMIVSRNSSVGRALD